LLTGYVVLWVIRDEHGMPREIWPIPTHWIQILTRTSEAQPDSYRVQSPWGQVIDVPFKDTVALTEHSPLNRWEGYAVSIAIAEWLDTYESLIRVRLAQFKNGAVPNIHVALGETYSDPDEAFLYRFYAKWFQRFQGENNAGLPLITGPDIEVKPLGTMPYQMFQNEEESIRTEVLAAFGVPQALVTGDPTVDTSAYAPKRTFAEYRLNPMLTYYGQKMRHGIVCATPGYENATMFWPDHAPDDPRQKLSEHQARIQACAETPNEFRTAYGMEPFPHGGDDPLMNGAPVPWATGRKPMQEIELESDIHRLVNQEPDERMAGVPGIDSDRKRQLQAAMGEGVGGAGGFLARKRAVLNGLAH
jgi:hypothetical protein